MRVVIIGGGAAGMSAASRVKALKPDWTVTVFEKTNFVSHAPCGIPYVVEGLAEVDHLMYYTPDVFIKKRGIDLHINSEVIEVGEGYVRVRENGTEKKYEWDKLLFANGAVPKVPPIKGLNLKNVFTVDLPPDAEKIKKASETAKNVVIVGSGYIGVEMAEAFVASGKKVTVIELLDRPLPTFDKEISDILKAEMDKRLTLKLNEKVLEFTGKDKVEKVITNKGEYLADLVIVATGVKPDVELAKQIDVKLGETGAIWTNERMETSVENVYAAGDVAETKHLITGKPVWIPLAPPGNKMGYVAGVNIAGGNLTFPGVLGTQVTKFFDLEIGRTGLSEQEALKEGYEVVSKFITARTRPHYYPGGKEIHLKVVAEKDTKRLLGVQVAGYEQVLARIDTFAVALQSNFTSKDLFFADLAYAPPFAPVWDPLIILARVLKF